MITSLKELPEEWQIRMKDFRIRVTMTDDRALEWAFELNQLEWLKSIEQPKSRMVLPKLKPV